MTNHDRRLGMDSEITRRDFLNGVTRRGAVDGPAAADAASVGVGGAVAIGWPLGAWAFQSVTGPTLDFLRRSTSGMK